MKLSHILIPFFLMCAVSASALTDTQVVNYIKEQAAAGKSEQQIGKELMAKGVTPEQVKRIKAKYERERKSNEQSAPTTVGKRIDRSSHNSASRNSASRNSASRNSASRNMNSDDMIVEEDMSEETISVESPSTRMNDNQNNQQKDIKEIYGHKLFNAGNLTFEPNENMATPQNYKLGPGDEVIIDMWGTNEEHISQVISPEGSIMISQIGPIYLNGMTINEANKYIKGVFAKKYAGLGDNETDINVTLGEIRTIQVDIMGEVSTPGTFRISPFSTVFHALYNAGGINDIGSMRNIQVLRNGRKVATVDIYDYLFKGKQTGNIRLQEGDVIIVPPYEQLVEVTGNVKRPMAYEIKSSETVDALLKYAGGLSGDAYGGMVRLQRQNGTENELYNIEKAQFSSYKLRDGDVVTIGTVLDRYANKVELNGAVMRPGTFALGKDVVTLTDLIKKADGLAEDAYTQRALLYREGPDLTMEVMPVNIADILSGKTPDITLRKNDVIEISSVQEIFERGDFTINGMVANPGQYSYVENTSLEDLILRAGGLLEGASTARVDISRRVVDPDATSQSDIIAQTFSVSLDNGLKADGKRGFMLKPYDVVNVRTSPGYEVQKTVTIDGEVLFEGAYALQTRNERISDIVKRAGGIVEGAYLKGAWLSRRLSDSERAARDEAMRVASQNTTGEDSISMSKIELSDSYNVGINLTKALEMPGSTYDVILQEGDHLFIPEMQSTVKISGDVMFPNTVVYEPDKKLKHYIEQAGGYGDRAKKNKAFVIYMNGTVAKATNKTVIEPGCQIIVPSKQKSNTDWTKILSIATSFSSLATMAATIGNLLR